MNKEYFVYNQYDAGMCLPVYEIKKNDDFFYCYNSNKELVKSQCNFPEKLCLPLFRIEHKIDKSVYMEKDFILVKLEIDKLIFNDIELINNLSNDLKVFSGLNHKPSLWTHEPDITISNGELIRYVMIGLFTCRSSNVDL